MSQKPVEDLETTPVVVAPSGTDLEGTTANFTGKSNYSTNGSGSSNGQESSNDKPQTSPLLSSTPPTVSKLLLRSYPYLLLCNKILGVLTWTGDDVWLSILVVGTYSLLVLYFEQLVTYFGHLMIVGIVFAYTLLNKKISKEQELNPTLDNLVHNLTTVTIRADMLLAPIVQLSLTPYDLKRLLFTTIFLSPIYIILTYFLITPRSLLLLSGVFILTYHSSWSRITRKICWKSKSIRLLTFYITGLDFAGTQGSNKNTLFKLAMSKASTQLKSSQSNLSKDGPVRFTYVLYENQRRWLGIGWTANLLSYERAPWSDEFLNESKPPESFELPEVTDDSNMQWRWVDKTWRLDLTNDGSIQLPSTKPKSSPDPRPDEGFIYYDNTWKTPSTEDLFGKYTRRRRWIRTAELVPLTSGISVAETGSVITSQLSPTTTNFATTEIQPVQVTGSTGIEQSQINLQQRKRKSLRFEPSLLESVKQVDGKSNDELYNVNSKESSSSTGN